MYFRQHKLKLVFSTFITFFIFITFTACNSPAWVSVSDKPDVYKLETETASYFFEKEYISWEEASEFAALNDEAIASLTSDYNLVLPKGAEFHIGSFDESKIEGSLVSLSGVREKTTNYAVWAARLMMGDKYTQKNLYYGVTYLLAQGFCKWPETLTPPDVKSILIDTNAGAVFSMGNENFETKSSLYGESITAAEGYVAFISKTATPLTAVLEILEDRSTYEELFGKSEVELKADWANSLGLKNFIINQKIYITSPTAPIHEWAVQLSESVQIESRLYSFSPLEFTLDELGRLIEQSEAIFIVLSRFLNENNVPVASGSDFTFLLGSDSSSYLNGKSNVINLDNNSENKRYLLMQQMPLFIKNPALPLLSTGVKSLIYNELFPEGEKNDLTVSGIMDEENASSLIMFKKSQLVNVPASENEQKSFFLATEFCAYLLKEYGIEKLISVYKDPLRFIDFYYKTYDQLRYEWLVNAGANASNLAPKLPNFTFTSKTSPADFILEQVDIGGVLYFFYENDVASFKFENGYLSVSECWNFVEKSTKTIAQIKNYLGQEYTVNSQKINFTITSDTTASFALNNDITMSFVKENISEYAHEIVHVLAGPSDPLWISEGFATLIDSKFSANYSPPTGGADIHRLAFYTIYAEGKSDILDFSDNRFRAGTSPEGQNLRMRAYLISASLLAYIEENYGKDTLLLLHSDSENLERILGINFETLKENWLKYLKGKNYEF